MSTNSKKNQDLRKNLNNYGKYSSIGFQMIFIIIGGTFGGFYIDKWIAWKFPVFTVVLSILSVIFALYFALKDLIKK